MPPVKRGTSTDRRMSGDGPPYVQIVNDLRARIASGRLRAGDRIPSTRQIVRSFGVAHATATKALSTLRHEGLIRSIPRSGHVVAEGDRAAREPSERGGALTRERIVQVAIRLADDEGLDALSMRGVAAKLGVPTMSLYRYVEGKDALVLLMIDAAFGEHPLPKSPPRDLREALIRAARAQWALYRRHGWLAHVMPLARPVALRNVIAHAEWILRAMEAPGLDAVTRIEAHMTLYSYVRGVAVNLESEREAEATTGMTEAQWNESQGAAFLAIATSGPYPSFARLLNELSGGYDFNLDRVFEFGLEPMIDGLMKTLRPRE